MLVIGTQVDTIVEFAWQVLFHTGVTSDRILDVKCASGTLIPLIT